MGTCYRLIDHKNKLYYQMDKWSVWGDATKSPEALREHLLEYRTEEWEIKMVDAIIKTITKYMAFPLEAHTDTGSDIYFDILDDGYRQCGDRFWSYNGISCPFDPLPEAANTYFVWDTEPCTASHPKPTLCYFNGEVWCDANDRPLCLHAPFWWAPLDNAYAFGLGRGE